MTATATWIQRAPQPDPATRPSDDSVGTDVVAADEVARYVVRLARALAGLPPHASLLQALVLGLPARFGVCSALLAECQSDGSVLATAWYGVPEHGDPTEPGLAADEGLVLDVLRSDEPRVWATHDDLVAQFPHHAELPHVPRPCASVRLEHHGAPMGALVLGTGGDVEDAEDVEDVDQLRRLLAATGAMLGTHLGLLAGLPAARAARPRPTTAEDVRLTRRQVAVLGLMAEGMSNRQISLRVGYSESTVRHETMAIYRALGVGDRRTAALLALELGLVG